MKDAANANFSAPFNAAGMKDASITNFIRALLCGRNEGRSYRQIYQRLPVWLDPGRSYRQFIKALLRGWSEGRSYRQFFQSPFVWVE